MSGLGEGTVEVFVRVASLELCDKQIVDAQH